MSKVTLKFNVEVDGDTFKRVAICLKRNEPEIFENLWPQFDAKFSEFLNEKTVNEANRTICPCCGSDKTYKTEAIHCDTCAITSEL